MPSHEPSETGREPDSDRALEQLLAEYIDRLTAGEILDREQILADHPECGTALLEQLETFFELAASPAHQSPLGALGDYTLRRQIGRGGMGIVYDAWQDSMDRRVALKVLPPGVAADSRTFLRFMREAKTAGQLRHPNVVQVHGMGVEEKTPYFAMEYVEGETLAQVLARVRAAEGREKEKRTILESISRTLGRRSRTNLHPVVDGREPGEASQTRTTLTPSGANLAYYYNLAEAFAGVAEGLQHAHGKGIIHRDIKPSNLIIDREGHLRILDFGLAHSEGQESLTQSGDFLGTVLYMSPEQTLAKRIPIDHRSDIYSIGATMYEMLTWRPPFQGKTPQDTISHIILRDPAPPRRLNGRVPRDMETIVLKCLRKDPADRYGTAEALAQDLRRFVRGDPVEARPQPLLQRLARRAWRTRQRLAAGLLVFLLLGSLSLVLAGEYRRKQRQRRAAYAEKVLRNARALRLVDTASTLEIGLKDFLAGWEEQIQLDSPEDPDREERRRILQKAAVELAESAALVPRKPDAHYYRARALSLLGNEDGALNDALEAIKQALDCDPGFVPARFLQAKIFEKTGALEAAEAARDAARVSVRSAWARYWLDARQATEAADWTKAVAAYEELIKLREQGVEPYLGFSTDVHVGKGYALLKAGATKKAIEEFSQARGRWRDAPEAVLLLARAWHELGMRDRARELLDELDRAHPEAQVRLMASWLYGFLKDWGAATSQAAQVKDPLRRADLVGRISRENYHWEQAAAAARETLSRQPNDEGALTRLGLALVQLGRLDEAEKHYEDFHKSHPTSPDPQSGLGCLRLKQEDFNEAIRCFKEALKLDPLSDFTNARLASAYEKMGNVAAAERQLRGVVRHTGYQEAYEALAQMLEGREDYRLALKVCQVTHRLRPRPKVYGIQAACLRALGKPEEALPVARELARQWSADPRSHGELGRCYLDLGQAEKAADHFRLAIDCGPASGAPYGEAHHHLAVVLEQKGLTLEAIRNYHAALALDPTLVKPYGRLGRLLKAAKDHEVTGQIDRLIEMLEARLPETEGRASPVASQGLAILWRAHPGENRAAEKATQYQERAIEACRGQALPVLVDYAAMLFEDGNLSGAVRVLEQAARIPGARVQIRRKLARYRQAAFPGLPSYASVDAALRRLDTKTLIGPHATWGILPGTKQPSSGLDWTRVGFDDSGWQSKQAGFGYGSNYDRHATHLKDMRNTHSTLYLRHEFEVDNRNAYRRLLFSAFIDDSAVVYLNGTPVRTWHAPSELTHEATATGAVTIQSQLADAYDTTLEPGLLPCGANLTFEIDPSLLRNGKNVLAIQGLNVDRGDNDFSVITVLEAQRVPDLGRDQQLLADFRSAAPHDETKARLTYLQARIFQRQGNHAEAVETSQKLGERELAETLPARRLTECQRALAQPHKALQSITKLLERSAWSDQEALDLWVRICLVDLRLSPAQMLKELPPREAVGSEASRSFLAGLQWILESLHHKGPIRINCGGEEYHTPSGATWGADHFFFGERSPCYGTGTFKGDIQGTELDPLYAAWRFFPPGDGDAIAYRIPLPCGDYRVTLHFVECSGRKRESLMYNVLVAGAPIPDRKPPEFDILANGQLKLERVELPATGIATASKESFTVTIDDAFLELGLRPLLHNPVIAAIEIERMP